MAFAGVLSSCVGNGYFVFRVGGFDSFLPRGEELGERPQGDVALNLATEDTFDDE